MKFLADMNIAQSCVRRLRSLGYDATHLRWEGLQKMLDSDIVAKARRESRIILTQDLDFARIMALKQFVLPSCIIFRLGNVAPSAIDQRLDIILPTYEKALLHGAIISVFPTKMRVRHLPV